MRIADAGRQHGVRMGQSGRQDSRFIRLKRENDEESGFYSNQILNKLRAEMIDLFFHWSVGSGVNSYVNVGFFCCWSTPKVHLRHQIFWTASSAVDAQPEQTRLQSRFYSVFKTMERSFLQQPVQGAEERCGVGGTRVGWTLEGPMHSGWAADVRIEKELQLCPHCCKKAAKSQTVLALKRGYCVKILL